MADQTRYFTLGSRLVSVYAELYRPGDVPLVLGVAETVAFRMILTSTGAVKVADAAAAIVSRGTVGTAAAQVRYDWAAADVNTAGEYSAWFIRTSGGETEHFPPHDPDHPQFIIIIEART